MASVNCTGMPPIRIKLRRNYNKEEIIQKNLEHLKVQSSKKKYAQKIYYGAKTEYPNKVPVHARLGMQRINLRRGAYSYVNHGFVHKRLSLRKRFIKNHVRNQKLRRFHDNQRPMGFTIEVPLQEREFRNNLHRHSCLAQLNGQLQNEIRVIQTEAENSNTPEIIPPFPIHVAGYGCTAISLSQRFSV